jgi:HlyD family type I secretion membrane fusion protein
MKPLDFFRGAPPPRPEPQPPSPPPSLPGSKLATPPTLPATGKLFGRAGLILGGGLGLFLLWAALAPLNKGAYAPGRLDTETSRTVVQHLDGGTVAEVLVREGDTVQPGQLVARMEKRQVELQLNQYEQQRRQRLIERAVLMAEMTDTQPQLPAEVMQATDFTTAAYRNVQLSGLQSRRMARDSQKAVLREQIGRLDLQAEGLRGQVAAYESQIALINDEVGGLESLYARGFASKQRLLALKRERERLTGERSTALSSISQAAVQQSEARQRIIQVDSEARQQAASQLNQTQEELALLDDRILSQRLILQRTDIKSPVSGTVIARATAVPGGVIKPGDPVLEIIATGSLIVKAQLNPRDVETVQVGTPATLRLSGLNMQKTPQLKGRVIYVSPDTLADRATNTPYYEIRVESPPSEVAKLDGQVLTPGMPVEVMMDAGARTALQYLIEPFQNMFNRSFRE